MFPHAKKSARAFTLVEVLVSITIFSIMAVAIAGTIKQIGQITRKVKSRDSTVMSAQVAMARLERDLQLAYNEKLQRTPCLFKSRNVSAGPELTFSVFDSDIKILFRTRTPGVLIVRYYLEKEDDGTMRLMRAEAPLHVGDKIDNQPGSPIATGLTEWKMEYYDGRNDLWSQEWDTSAPTAAGTFPKAARIIFKSVDPSLPKDQWKAKSLMLMTDLIVLNEVEAR